MRTKHSTLAVTGVVNTMKLKAKLMELDLLVKREIDQAILEHRPISIWIQQMQKLLEAPYDS